MVEEKKVSGEFPKADRLIFLTFLVLMMIPMIFPIGLPIPISSLSREAFKAVEEVPNGGVILIEENNAFGTLVDIGPGESAFLRHAFEKLVTKDVRIIIYSGSIDGNQISQRFLREYVGLPDPFNTDPTYGKLWVHLGWIPGGETIIAGMVTNMAATAPVDLYGNPTVNMEVFKYVAARAPPIDIINGNDINLFMVVHNTSPDAWIRQWGQYGDPQRGFPHGNQIQIASSAQQASAMVFIQAGQMRSIIGGQRAGAEYELLIQRPGLGASTMDAQNFAHIFGIALIIGANIIFWSQRLKRRSEK